MKHRMLMCLEPGFQMFIRDGTWSSSASTSSPFRAAPSARLVSAQRRDRRDRQFRSSSTGTPGELERIRRSRQIDFASLDVRGRYPLRSIQPRGPLWPFALTERPSGRNLVCAVADRLEDMLADTLSLVFESEEPTRAVWCGPGSPAVPGAGSTRS